MEKNKIISACKVLIVGGSAGSLEVLLDILPKLEPVLSFALVIVLHRKSGEDNLLESLISYKTDVPVTEVEDKIAIETGHIYIAPSDYHILFEETGLISLDTSEKVNYSRPSIDVAFESAAGVYGASLIGVLLSGANADGTAGLKAINNEGGVTIVQKPSTAEVSFMPQNAIENISPDFILNTEEMLTFISSINKEL